MKIKNAEKAMFFKKCIAAMQLATYAELASITEEFNELIVEEDKKNSTFLDIGIGTKNPENNKVKMFLKKYLPLASNGNLDFFIDSSTFQEKLSEFPSHTQSIILENLKKYSKYSIAHSEFKELDEQVSACFSKKNNKTYFSRKKFKELEKKLSVPSNSSSSKFYKNFSKHSKSFLGWKHYKIATTALNKISNININDSILKNANSITPEAFNANIRGFYNPKLHSKNIDSLSDDEKPSNLSEKIYTTIANKTLKAKKGTLNRALSYVLSLALLLGASFATLDSINYLESFNNSTTISAQANPTAKLKISKETQDKILESRNLLESLKTGENFPSEQDLYNIRNLLDENMDLIFSDLVKEAVEKKYPDWNVKEVDTVIDELRGKGGDNPNFIKITYTDKKNNDREKTMLVDRFKSEKILSGILDKSTTIDGTFSSETQLDKDFYDFLNKYLSATDFTEKGKILDQLLEMFKKIQKQEEVIGAKKLEFNKGLFSPSITIVLPDQDEAR